MSYDYGWCSEKEVWKTVASLNGKHIYLIQREQMIPSPKSVPTKIGELVAGERPCDKDIAFLEAYPNADDFPA